MNEQDAFERILASLHSAALDDAHWSAASRLIDEACGVNGNFLVLGEGDGPHDVDIFFARCCYRGERHQELEREYFSVFHEVDERLPRLRLLPDGKLIHVSSLYTERELKISLIYNELLPRTGSQNSLNVRLDGPNGSRIVWGIGDPVDSQGWSSARIRTTGRLLPHIRQFVRVRVALAEAKALGMSLATLLDTRRQGIVQIDLRGRIVATNDFALELLRQGDGLYDRDGNLRACSPADDAALQRVLACALPPFGVRGTSGSVSVQRSKGAAPLVVHVNPVSDPVSDFRLRHAAALVLIVDPRRNARGAGVAGPEEERRRNRRRGPGRSGRRAR